MKKYSTFHQSWKWRPSQSTFLLLFTVTILEIDQKGKGSWERSARDFGLSVFVHYTNTLPNKNSPTFVAVCGEDELLFGYIYLLFDPNDSVPAIGAACCQLPGGFWNMPLLVSDGTRGLWNIDR